MKNKLLLLLLGSIALVQGAYAADLSKLQSLISEIKQVTTMDELYDYYGKAATAQNEDVFRAIHTKRMELDDKFKKMMQGSIDEIQNITEPFEIFKFVTKEGQEIENIAAWILIKDQFIQKIDEILKDPGIAPVEKTELRKIRQNLLQFKF